MEKMPEKIIREAEFYVRNSILDEEKSCVRVPTYGYYVDHSDIFLIGRKIELKYPSLKFSAKNEKEGEDLIFRYEK
jgi:hypothetical protein